MQIDLLAGLLQNAIAPGLLLVIGLLILRGGWRFSLVALAAQYAASGLLLSWTVPLSVAALKWLVGAMVLFILYPAGRRLLWGAAYPLGGAATESRLGLNTAFRAVSAALLVVVALGLLYRFPLGNLDASILFSSYWLLCAGLVVIFLARDPWMTGVGLLIYQTGFELLFTPVEQDLIVAGGLAALHILVALALAYLVTSKVAGARMEEEG